MKKGSKLAQLGGVVADLGGELTRRGDIAPRRGVGLALGVQSRVGRRTVHRRRSDELAVVVRDENGHGPGRLAHDRVDDRLRLLEPHWAPSAA